MVERVVTPQAQERYSPSEETFRLLVDGVQDYAIFMLDPAGRIASWNAAAERIKGYSGAEVIGRHFSIFYPEEDVRHGKPERELEVAERLGRLEDDGWRIRKDDSRFWANLVITALHDDGGRLRGFAKVTRDLTEWRSAEEAKDRFIANAAHELRTPLSVIVGLVDMLQGKRMSGEEADRAIAVLARQTGRMRRLVDALLDLTRVEQGRTRLTLEGVSFDETVRTVLATYPPPAGKLADAPESGAVVFADRLRLEQVLANLVTNAYRYGGDHIRIEATAGDSWVEIAVSDDGPGIPTELGDSLFEPFRRGPDVRGEDGFGLGLATVKMLVEAFGGVVAVDGDHPGARFVIRLREHPDG